MSATTALVAAAGRYNDLPELTYHADDSLAPELGRSLSVSGAKVLLRSPALYRYQRDHGRAERPAFDFGHAAHKYVLGVGEKVARIDAADWRTNAAKAARDEAYDAGQIPLLAADDNRAQALANIVLAHPVAGRLFTDGAPEVSFYWPDEATGVTRRARVDWLRQNAIVDLKTCLDASPSGMAKAAANYGYAMQARWYQDAVAEHTGFRLPFVFVCCEKEPPHLIGLYVIDSEWEQIADAQNRRALDLYAACESSGEWPGLSLEIETLSAPRWLTYQES